MKLLVCGHARHGKDTFCNMLGVSFKSSSEAALDIAIWPLIGHRYASKKECFEDRVNHRKEWFDIISAYNTPDKARLAKEIIKECDVYCGMRSSSEFELAKNLFDITVWVDASERLPPEGGQSNELKKEMFDIVVYNNGSLNGLREKAEKIAHLGWGQNEA